jgi:SAM-dependent methyltransferase
MEPIETPLESSWGGEIHHVCFNDECSYFVESWDTLFGQGVEKAGYRCRIDPRGDCGPFAVWSVDAMKDKIIRKTCECAAEDAPESPFGPDAFSRDDETPDSEFYKKPRFVDHLDSLALSTVSDLYKRLIPKGAKVLDLMTGPDSHLGPDVGPVTGLGLNREELDANPALSSRVVHDLNADPKLPFGDNEFDAVINTVSVDYMTKPVEVFRDAARTLKPGGLCIVTFSNRMFPPKAVRVWKNTNEGERVDLVKKFFQLTGKFNVVGSFESKGKPRPADDKYYDLGIPSDPIYAVWATAIA